jgi:hypothetical protein
MRWWPSSISFTYWLTIPRIEKRIALLRVQRDTQHLERHSLQSSPPWLPCCVPFNPHACVKHGRSVLVGLAIILYIARAGKIYRKKNRQVQVHFRSFRVLWVPLTRVQHTVYTGIVACRSITASPVYRDRIGRAGRWTLEGLWGESIVLSWGHG